MTFTNFCCRSGGSNLNAGTRTGDTTEPGTAADFTYASGNWVAGTGVFTVASGDPASDGVAVGDFASVYADGSTVTGFIGRVTARDATTITVSLTAIAGAAPTDGTGNRTLKIGGAWLGPNATSGFPFNFVARTLTNSAGNTPCVNLKNDATYSITAAMTHTLAGPVYFQGYTSTYGDGGKFIVDGGTSGASFVLLNITGLGTILHDGIFRNNGATGSAAGLSVSSIVWVRRCVVHSVRGFGFILSGTSVTVECEAYSCNQSNSGDTAGFSVATAAVIRCISHDNTGSNTSGFISAASASAASFYNCIADSNTLYGFYVRGRDDRQILHNCEAYNNGSDGVRLDLSTTAGGNVSIENCNFIKNGGYGINDAEATLQHTVYIVNCGFGAGTQANTSGATNGLAVWGQEVGTVTYPNDVTPWVDPANGDFRINLRQAKNAGRGAFTQTASSYAGTISYPNIGAATHRDVPRPRYALGI